MKLIIGSKHLSSWSLRGWLACKQSGLPFDEVVVPLDTADWPARRLADDLAPSAGMVPVLWDGEVVVWDSLAILEYLGDKVGRDRFWPRAPDARGLARAMVAEMHSCVRRAAPAVPDEPAHRGRGRRKLDAAGAGRCAAGADAVGGGAGAVRVEGALICSAVFPPPTSPLRRWWRGFRSYEVAVPGFASGLHGRRCGNMTGCRPGPRRRRQRR